MNTYIYMLVYDVKGMVDADILYISKNQYHTSPYQRK